MRSAASRSMSSRPRSRARRVQTICAFVIRSQTPWQEIYRTHVGQLADGGCLELATAYHKVGRDLPRDNH